MGKNAKNAAPDPVLANNKKALHDYHVLSTMEAGIQLVGTEVKSCREHGVALNDAYVELTGRQAFLVNAHIAGYDYGNRFNHDTRRKRRLLLHKNEMLKLFQQVHEKGCTVVPLKFYLKGSLIKVAIALCKGKTFGDKREVLRTRQADMEARRAMRNFNAR